MDCVVWLAPTVDCVVWLAAAWLAVAVSMHSIQFVPSVDSIVVMNFQSPLEVHAVLISYLEFLVIYFCLSFLFLCLLVKICRR